MLGDAVLYAASRATHNAIENVTRRVTWTLAAVIFLVAAFTFALMITFWVTAPMVGDVRAAGAIAGVCVLIGVVCLAMPWLLDRAEQSGRRRGSPMSQTVAVVDQEAKEAVDYFGAMRVVGAAFLFGLGAARRLKG